MRTAYITAGAATMFCGSCMHDNALAAALTALGHETVLVPTYTPIRTDERDVSQHRVFFGGINVYLQQKSALFRHTPWFVDRLLDAPRLLRWVSGFAVKTQADELGALFLSMLKGEHGYQRKEVEKLVRWLAEDVRPELVNLTNVLLSGMVHEVKQHLKAPVLGTLQGDDIFLNALPAPVRAQALELIRAHCREMDGFIATCAAYADFMADLLAIARERIHVVYPGINLRGHGGPRPPRTDTPFTIGYFARICPEKGLHVLAEAFGRLARAPDGPPGCILTVSGWLGENNRAYFEGIQKKIDEWGLADRFRHVECPDHASKVNFLKSLDVLSVPTVYREPKGLYVLEALANGVPVVQPRHGAFPELIEATGGGLLVEPGDAMDLARGLRQIWQESSAWAERGRKAQEKVHQSFSAEVMARNTLDVYQRYL